MGWAVSNWLIAGVRPQPMGNEIHELGLSVSDIERMRAEGTL
jgi:hypothetical protein